LLLRGVPERQVSDFLRAGPPVLQRRGPASDGDVPGIDGEGCELGMARFRDLGDRVERRVAAGQTTKDAIISATTRAAEALMLGDSVGDRDATTGLRGRRK
jgi:hypothetical protein